MGKYSPPDSIERRVSAAQAWCNVSNDELAAELRARGIKAKDGEWVENRTRTKPVAWFKAEHISLISEILGVSEAWLLTGHGSPVEGEHKPARPAYRHQSGTSWEFSAEELQKFDESQLRALFPKGAPIASEGPVTIPPKVASGG